ncbi:S-adenosyl-L-methionine-dependent methyltransferase [Aspergillus aurantiobrunneus]
MPSEIGQLASIISGATAILDASPSKNGNPPPSDTESVLEPSFATDEAAAARQAAINACMELLDQLQGPLSCMLPFWNPASLQAVSRYRIAHHVPLHGEISYQDLARASGVPVHELKQYIRFAIVHHRLFVEKQKGYVSHSAGSRALVENPDVNAGAAQMEEWYDTFAKTVEAMSRYPGHKPDETGYALAHENRGIFDYLRSRPDKAQQFADAMQFFTVRFPETSSASIVQGYAWCELPQGAVVVDIGGNNGHIGRLIAHENQHISVVVQDLPYAAELFEAAADACTCKGGCNVRFDPHDFFTPQTVVADVYIFRWVLLNWADEYVVQILRQLVPVMRPGAKVLVNESLCPDSGALPLVTERYIRWLDMLMLGVYKSRLRDEEDWVLLFGQVDARFRSVQCLTVPGSALGVVQATWEGAEE